MHRSHALARAGAIGNTASGSPGAAHISSKERSVFVDEHRDWVSMPERRNTPDREAGLVLDCSGVRLTQPRCSATAAPFEASSLLGPERKKTSGSPTASTKLRVFTICASRHPMARAASSAVWVPSGKAVRPDSDPQPGSRVDHPLDTRIVRRALHAPRQYCPVAGWIHAPRLGG